MIQEQMHVLTDTHSVGEERYARAKQENATLQARILMLEEAAKDAETRAEEKLQVIFFYSHIYILIYIF